MLRTLVLGGYGNFGARICRALGSDPSIQLFIGGRDLQRAQSLASELGPNVMGVAVDLDAPEFSNTLQQLDIELLIHAAGPFQQQSYGVAKATAAAGAHYIDLSDGRRFVCDFPNAMDATFRAAGRLAVCGASTVPALSSAVIDHLCQSWQRIDAIDICIAPAQTAPRGQATLAAVLSYCGESIQTWNGGKWEPQIGWANPTRVHFSRMKSRLGALCDIPDLELFPARYKVCDRMMFRAAVEIGFAQRAFSVLAALRTARILKQPWKLAGFLNYAAKALDFLGSSLGGMVVRAEGIDATGSTVRRAWHIAADNDHGPEIPCMAAILLARKLAKKQALPVGAMACMGLLTLADFAPEFARWGMVTDIVDDSAASVSLQPSSVTTADRIQPLPRNSRMSNLSMYETVMGNRFSQLAPAIQRFHRLSGEHVLHGWVKTHAPASIAAKLLARLLGTPLDETSGPIRFNLHARPDREAWTRHFPTKTMKSTLSLCGRQVEERLGPARLIFVLVESSGTLVMALNRFRFLGIPCPGWLMPNVVAQESGDGSSLHFHVQATLPIIGVVASYSGHLVIPMEVLS